MISTIGYFICIPFAALLRLFYTLTSSYGVSLVLFTLVIKLVLLPFQIKSKKSMIRMGRMSGQIQEIQKKYANNRTKMNEEVQKFYAEEGVNPASGCVWSFLPMPILLALYYIIREPIEYFMNFGGKEDGAAMVETVRGIIEGAGLTLTGSSAYEQIEMVNVVNNNPELFSSVTANAGWVDLNYTFLGIDLSMVPSSYFSALTSGLSWGFWA
ncbi:YidC/Oxa1 family membrane protein insertase [Bengtsoniella intestinalis]|uniref:YidC/Oxa1 family membrane protein insertase n=1 Tax=Bengtsoniella intestinalis TaxID=3073143 RepID=UPI00391FB2A4